MDLTNVIDEIEQGCKEAFIHSYKNNSQNGSGFEKDLSEELDWHLNWFKKTILLPNLMKKFNKSAESTFHEYVLELRLEEESAEKYYGV